MGQAIQDANEEISVRKCEFVSRYADKGVVSRLVGEPHPEALVDFEEITRQITPTKLENGVVPLSEVLYCGHIEDTSE